jgi:TctA family transporter
MALMIAVLIIQGITPGPTVMTKQSALVWGLIASMWIGNVMLLILNLPLIGLWTRLLTVRYFYLFPAIVIICIIGAFNVGNSTFSVYTLAFFGVLGYVFVKLECEPAPFLLGFVLGPLMEENLRRALLISRGDPTVFVTRPISLGFVIATIVIVIVMLVPAVKQRRAAITD